MFRRVTAVLAVLLLVWWFNNYTLRTEKVTLHSPKIKEKVRIAVISDLHAAKLGISNKSIEKRIRKADPDLVFILGDMYTTGSPADLKRVPVNLTKDIISDGYPVYFVPGEHDTDRSYLNALEKAGAHVMCYKSEKIRVKGNDLCIYGIDNAYYSQTFDLRKEFTLDDKFYNILLAHIPNPQKFSSFGADLILCADTHGCMMQLPFGLGPIYYPDEAVWFPHFTNKDMKVYDKGLFKCGKGQMFITSGIGASPFPIRFNNRPEVAVLDILPE